jgi:hypothetical protein
MARAQFDQVARQLDMDPQCRDPALALTRIQVQIPVRLDDGLIRASPGCAAQ